MPWIQNGRLKGHSLMELPQFWIYLPYIWMHYGKMIYEDIYLFYYFPWFLSINAKQKLRYFPGNKRIQGHRKMGGVLELEGTLQWFSNVPPSRKLLGQHTTFCTCTFIWVGMCLCAGLSMCTCLHTYTMCGGVRLGAPSVCEGRQNKESPTSLQSGKKYHLTCGYFMMSFDVWNCLGTQRD